ncbi:hypothetical protein MPSEU_000439000 [Mayamaea pseudoterrestris]|nr:hypothetical protein MPSEU_000439000 [Mayamaea pseudoterrestris]
MLSTSLPVSSVFEQNDNDPTMTAAAVTAVVPMPPTEAAVASAVVESVLVQAAVQQVQDTVFAATAVLAAAAAAAATCTNTTASRLSIPQVLEQFRVPLYENDLATTLAHLEKLEDALRLMPQQVGRAPGFYTSTTLEHDVSVGRIWSDVPKTPYQVLDIYATNSVPLPTPEFVLKCCDIIKKVLLLRLEFLTLGEFASREARTEGISNWDFHEGCIPEALINNTLETIMFQEASTILNHVVDPDEWKAAYAPEKCPSPEATCKDAYVPNTSVRLLKQRDEYLECAMGLCMAAEQSIQISTCYFFGNDPAQRYIMLDLLPYCIRQHNVTVHLLLDLMTMESAFIRSAFVNKDAATKLTQDRSGSVTLTSFLDHCPANAPEFTHAQALTTLDFLRKICEMATEFGDKFQIRWWCARDAKHKYRVKNHSKAIVVDRKVGIIGGSNLNPQLNAATTEVDMLVVGDVVDQIYASTKALWDAASRCLPADVSHDLPVSKTELGARLSEMVSRQVYSDQACRVAIVRSLPSFEGEDAIFRVIMGAIKQATTSITMCFGHSAYPLVVNEAIGLAAARGVRCKLLFNSYFSNDLRGGQRDMFLSLRHLLTVAPDAEVYVTAPVNGNTPSFVHAKYATIDGEWSACGSFNLWPRASFYEIEHEAIIDSKAVAEEFEAKFERDKVTHTIRLLTPEDADKFLPARCMISEVFGPFFEKQTV